MTKSLRTIKDSLTKRKDILTDTFKVKTIGVFGSYAQNHQRQGSDIDILVEFENRHKTFDNYMELKFYLEKVLDAKIDLVLKNVIKKEIEEHILSEVVYV
ncbi:MAG: nucleotidyltransferase family protein [Planctomycetota bacterium]|nr:nucleotidyltransferase family protein [Planctomycetota bacterium]MDI6788101.1 nucleotidyltransferase family protein [Planctomycetota bacterium]